MSRFLRAIIIAAAGVLAAVSLSAAQAPTAPAAPAPIITQPARFLPVLARNGMVASQEKHATRVGVDILRRGGNAVDAAVAVAFTLAVTHPQAGNLGGGGFALIYIAKEKRTVALDYYPQAPLATTDDLLRGVDGKLDPDKRYSYLGVGVPGTVMGLWDMHQRYGRLPWRQLVEPAVALARDGLTVTDELVYGLDLQREALILDAPTRQNLFKPDRSVYRPGETLRQPQLAWSLAQVRDHGAKAFYAGELGRRVVASVMKAVPTCTRKKGDLVRGYLVTTVRGASRPTGLVQRFDRNAVVLVNKKLEPLASRIRSARPKDLRRHGLAKLRSLSSRTL